MLNLDRYVFLSYWWFTVHNGEHDFFILLPSPICSIAMVLESLPILDTLQKNKFFAG
jgi:hypothetical protein